MLHKTEEVYIGFYDAHDTLRALAHWIEGYYRGAWDIEPLMTSSSRTFLEHYGLYRAQINRSTKKLYTYDEIKAKLTVHMTSPLRGMDLRSRLLTEEQNLELVAAIDKEWIYDTNRPYLKCAQLHKVGDNAFHLHIQVHPNTIRSQ